MVAGASTCAGGGPVEAGAVSDMLTGGVSVGCAASVDGGGTVTVTVTVNGDATDGVSVVVMGRSCLV